MFPDSIPYFTKDIHMAIFPTFSKSPHRKGAKPAKERKDLSLRSLAALAP
jgi:hypothetical protein